VKTVSLRLIMNTFTTKYSTNILLLDIMKLVDAMSSAIMLLLLFRIKFHSTDLILIDKAQINTKNPNEKIRPR